MHSSAAVLVVDDDFSTQGLLAAIVRHIGFFPLIAGDGRQALAAIAAHNPAAIILDLLMPELDGFEVMRRLNATEPETLRRVIVVTAASGHLVDDCKEIQQVWKFFRKPMDIDELSRSLVACVNCGTNETGRGSAYRSTAAAVNDGGHRRVTAPPFPGARR